MCRKWCEKNGLLSPIYADSMRGDAEGNVVEQTGATWEPNARGECVAICDMDPNEMEPVGGVEVYGDWDAAHYLERVLEKLGPGRPVNVPDFRKILKKAICDGADEDLFCNHCKRYGYSCYDCIVTEWKEEEK